MLICLVNDFGVDSKNECFIRQMNSFQTRPACIREGRKAELGVIRAFRSEYGDDYIYVAQIACIEKGEPS